MTFETQHMRNGELATIYCRDAPGEWPIHGRDQQGIARVWRADGRWCHDVIEHPFDLMPPEPKVLWERWENTNTQVATIWFPTLRQAESCRLPSCLSTIRVYLLEGEKVPRMETVWVNGDD